MPPDPSRDGSVYHEIGVCLPAPPPPNEKILYKTLHKSCCQKIFNNENLGPLYLSLSMALISACSLQVILSHPDHS